MTVCEDLTDTQVRAILHSRAEELIKVVTLKKLDKFFKDELRTDMQKNNAKDRMQDLFADYHMLFWRHGLKWIIKENHKLGLTHFLTAIKPTTFYERLESDLSF